MIGSIFLINDAALCRASNAELDAQPVALIFCAVLGITAKVPVYDNAGIDHRDMVRDL